MQTFKNLDEGLLSSRAPLIGVGIESTLPLRLQKRILLESIGFPIDSQLRPFRVTQRELIQTCLSEFLDRHEPFLIIVSEKPLRTVCTPLFVVKSNNDILYRSRNNESRKVSAQAILKQVSTFSKKSWVEFAKILWRQDTIAGRLIYENREKQLLEIKEGVVPEEIGNHKDLPYFLSNLNGFLRGDSFTFDRIKLREAGFRIGFPRESVERLCSDLAQFSDAFEILKHIASSPTLEFAYVHHQRLIAIDIDWPTQWVRAQVVNKQKTQTE